MKQPWLTPKAQRRPSPNSGVGTYATALIETDEPIAVWTGVIMNFERLTHAPAELRANSLQIGRDLYLVPRALFPGDQVNHSCDPNAGLAGDRTLVAIRPILLGEEITYDYAMSDSSTYDEFACRCGSINCRGRITGNDWKIPELRVRYRGFFSAYLEELMWLDSEARA
jgi:hypothetical protein